MKALLRTALACLLLGEPAISNGAEPQATQPAQTPAPSVHEQPTFPVLTRRPSLEFPITPEQREAIVQVRFMINEAGRTTDLKIVEERSFYTRDFADAALRFVRNMRFTPAMLGDKPVASGPYIQPVNYYLLKPEEQGITEEFRRELQKVTAIARSGDMAGAHFHAEWMLRENVRFIYEFAVLQAQLAETHAAVGNVDEALQAATKATNRRSMQTQRFVLRQPIPPNRASNYLLPEELVVSLLGLRMRLAIQRGSIMEALEAYAELAGLIDMKPDDPRAITAERLTELLESGRPLGIQGKIAIGQESWNHRLFHDSFTIRNLQGRIDEIQVYCATHRLQIPYVPDSLWRAPKDWGNCRVEIDGDTGTTFEFIEIANTPAHAPSP